MLLRVDSCSRNWRWSTNFLLFEKVRSRGRQSFLPFSLKCKSQGVSPTGRPAEHGLSIGLSYVPPVINYFKRKIEVTPKTGWLSKPNFSKQLPWTGTRDCRHRSWIAARWILRLSTRCVSWQMLVRQRRQDPEEPHHGRSRIERSCCTRDTGFACRAVGRRAT